MIRTSFSASWHRIGGVVKSGPNITLFDSDEEYWAFWNQLSGKDHLNAHGNLTTQTDADSLYVSHCSQEYVY
jgi:hypothetical protein